MKKKARGTPIRTIRVNDETWQAAQARAAAEGTTVSTVVRRYLVRYGYKSR